MFLRYTLSRITKILKNPLTVFWFKNKTFLLSGMLKSLFFFFPFNSIFQSQFFIFAFLFYLSDPTSIYIFPSTRQPHVNPTNPSYTYIHTDSYLWKGKQINLFLYNPWFPPKWLPVIPFPLPFTQPLQNKTPIRTKHYFSHLSPRLN